jgi:hypothetical protein
VENSRRGGAALHQHATAGIERIKERSAKLYRHFDAAGVLLHLDVSLRAIERLRQHRAQSVFDEIVRLEIETFASLKPALIAERKAIKAEQPKHNRHGGSRPKPEEQASIALLLSNEQQAFDIPGVCSSVFREYLGYREAN